MHKRHVALSGTARSVFRCQRFQPFKLYATETPVRTGTPFALDTHTIGVSQGKVRSPAKGTATTGGTSFDHIRPPFLTVDPASPRKDCDKRKRQGPANRHRTLSQGSYSVSA